jgi:uracil-DNA glycosylase
MTRPLLIGQAPPRSGGEPWDSDAGRRLARYMGVGHDDLLARFDRRNLNERLAGTSGKYDLFDRAEGRATAAHMWRYLVPRRDTVVVCGMAVADCFGLTAPSTVVRGRATVFVLPHPAGTSMWWNDPANLREGRALARLAWLHAEAMA